MENTIDYYNSLIAPWRIVHEIGKGGFGSVYEIARSSELGYDYEYHAALKIIRMPKNVADGANMGLTAMNDIKSYYLGRVKNILNECIIMSQFKGNSNIVSYEDHKIVELKDTVGWDILIRMELLRPASSVAETLLSEEKGIIRLGCDICRALEICGRKNLIHRDIKPANIFISDNGDFKLGDFGISKAMDGSDGAYTRTGTPMYMAPEVYLGKAYGKKADIYSLGLVLYGYLNGGRLPFVEPPFDFDKAIQCRMRGDKLPRPQFGSDGLAEVVMKACSYHPDDRFESAAEMRAALESVSTAEPVSDRRVIQAVDNERKNAIAPIKVPEHDKKPKAEPMECRMPVQALFDAAPDEEQPTKTELPKRVCSGKHFNGAWRENVMRGGGLESMLGRELAQRAVSVTFLDSLEAMPPDAQDVSADNSGSVMLWRRNYDIYIGADGCINGREAAAGLFRGCSCIRRISFDGCFRTDEAESLEDMFNLCSGLTGLDVRGFNTSRVTNMHAVFSGCNKLTELDVSGFDTSRVTTMESMFHLCRSLTRLDVSSFDTSGVRDMRWMFSGCRSLREVDVSSFDTSNVTDIKWIFGGCQSLTSLDLRGFNTSRVKSMESMFQMCSSLTRLDVSGFDTSNVTDMKDMFYGCAALTELDVSGFDTSEATDMSGMFSGCSSLTRLDVSGFKTALTVDMNNMFCDCESLAELDVSGFDISGVKDMMYMFSGCAVTAAQAGLRNKH